jgi:hypothetical protein
MFSYQIGKREKQKQMGKWAPVPGTNFPRVLTKIRVTKSHQGHERAISPALESTYLVPLKTTQISP